MKAKTRLSEEFVCKKSQVPLNVIFLWCIPDINQTMLFEFCLLL